MRKLAFILYIIISAAGCVKKTNWPMPGITAQYIVVDGIVTDERKPQSIRLTMPVSQLNEPPLPVSGADVLISDEDSTWLLYEDPADPGYYVTDSSFLAQLGKTYSLIIYLEDKIYSAKAYMVPGYLFNELQYVKG